MNGSAPSQMVSRQVAWTGRWVFNHRKFWLKMGGIESRFLQDRLQHVGIQKPVFVTGLARAGTTILLELLADQPGVATHKYQDYPFVFIPYWWEQYVRRARRKGAAATERAHGDGILITPESPEAMEEPIWMSFFSHLHDPGQSNVLDARTSNHAFEAFYMDTIRKILLRSGANRYVAKGNYNVTRMAYLLKLFPDVRFVVPVREPVSHVTSLKRQHERFLELAANDPEVVSYFRRAGHFEFGPDRRPIHTGQAESIASIRKAWQGGDEITGWAWSWRAVHEEILRVLAVDSGWRRRILLVPYEEFCRGTEKWIPRILEHADLECTGDMLEKWISRIRPAPDRADELTSRDLDVIREVTDDTVARLKDAAGEAIRERR